MNKYIAQTSVSFLMAMIIFGIITIYLTQGVSYSPVIEPEQLEGLSYQEGSELIQSSGKPMTYLESLKFNLFSTYFWGQILLTSIITAAITLTSTIITKNWSTRSNKQVEHSANT